MEKIDSGEYVAALKDYCIGETCYRFSYEESLSSSIHVGYIWECCSGLKWMTLLVLYSLLSLLRISLSNRLSFTGNLPSIPLVFEPEFIGISPKNFILAVPK